MKIAVAALEDFSDNTKLGVRKLLDYAMSGKFDIVALLQSANREWDKDSIKELLRICKEYQGLDIRFVLSHDYTGFMNWYDWQELLKHADGIPLVHTNLDLTPSGAPLVMWYEKDFHWTENSEWVLANHEMKERDDVWWIYRNGWDEMILGANWRSDCRIHIKDHTKSSFVSTLYNVDRYDIQISLLTIEGEVLPVGKRSLRGRR